MMRFQERLFGSSRSRVLVLFRRARRTVEELAGALGMTNNGVRGHLAALERDGLIRPAGVRPTGGKPATVYELTPDAEALFPRAYAPALTRLLDVLAESQSTDATLRVLREVGVRLAHHYPVADGSSERRLQAAADVLTSLGGLAEIDRGDDGTLRIKGYGCPLGAVVREHPAACQLAEALVRETSGLAIREQCARDVGEPPRCRFDVEA